MRPLTATWFMERTGQLLHLVQCAARQHAAIRDAVVGPPPFGEEQAAHEFDTVVRGVPRHTHRAAIDVNRGERSVGDRTDGDHHSQQEIDVPR